jgi:tRNA A37 threonylcarbamoyladenosine modification protein TsaB
MAVSSLDVLAAAAAGAAVTGGLDRVETVVPVVDARRGEVFAAAYRLATVSVVPTMPGASQPVVFDVAPAADDRPDALTPDGLVEWLRALAAGPGSVLVVGDGAARYLDRLSGDAAVDLARAGSFPSPPPAVLARLAAARLHAGAVPANPGAVVPDYRRPADARINWEERDARPAPATSTGREASA